MIEAALRTFLAHHGVGRGRMLIAVSGGADSVALLRGMDLIAGEFELQLMAGHFDHHLREESADDADWVAELCRRSGIECRIGEPDDRDISVGAGEPVSGHQIDDRRQVLPATATALRTDPSPRTETTEERARRQRYAFLHHLARNAGCRWIATAHTVDDQVETILHHIARGSGLKGVQGIPERRELSEDISLIRPLSAVSRTSLMAFLSTIGQDFRTDATNRDPTFTRNRIRHAVLPFLREQLNPRVDEALLRLSAQAKAVQQTLETVADRLLESALLTQRPDGVRIDCKVLADQPPGLVREVFSRLWQRQGWPRRNMSFEHFEKLAQLSATREFAQHSLPGSLQAKRRRDVLEIKHRMMKHG